MKICYLYPNLLNVNGSRGNVICLCQRTLRRGLPAVVTGVQAGHPVDFSAYDLVYIGAGHGEPGQRLLSDALRVGPQLREYAEGGGAVLAVGEGFELLGRLIAFADGGVHEAMGVLDMEVRYSRQRETGNYRFDCGQGIGAVTAFRNHAGRPVLGPGVLPLGLEPSGELEGARYKNVYGSYGHGPLLPKNPALADAILSSALKRPLEPLDDTLEQRAHDYMERALS